MRIVQDNEVDDDGPELPPPLQMAMIGWDEELSFSPPPRSLALEMAMATAALAIKRGVTPRMELGTVVVGEALDPEIEPTRLSHGPVEVELEIGSATKERAAELVRLAAEATDEDPRWAELYRAMMEPVCE